MVKNEQNLHLKHPHGELAVDGVVKKFTVKKGVSINMARKTQSDTLKYQRGNEEVERSPISRCLVHSLATHHEYLESMRRTLELWDSAKEVDVHDTK